MAYTTINKSGDYFNTKLWTGTGANLSITGVGHQPDFTWIKNRANTDDHNLFDVLRGFSTDALLRSNTTGVATDTTEGIKSFDSDGFSLGTNGSSNGNGQGMVSWNWKANGAGSANTDGSINSTVSASATSGFSIVKYTGAGGNGTGTTSTVGHGLGAKPKMIIVKSLSNAWKWVVYQEDVTPNNSHLQLQGNNAVQTSSYNYWNTSGHTTTTFGLGEQTDTNGSGVDFIAYCFAEKTGYSKFGTYTGNGSSDGTFVYTGFKPAFVMIKYSNATESWYMYDNKRQSYNAQGARLRADANEAEASSANFDFLSNGIKIRTSGSAANTSGGSYIYMAFAEAPLVGNNNVPCTAR